MKLLALTLALLAAVATADVVTPPELCGWWNATCSPVPVPPGPEAAYARGAWSFAGISVGSYTHLTEWHGSASCSGADLRVAHSGSFQDLGVLAMQPTDRLLRLVPAGFRVTPYSPGAAGRLAVACPCGGSWAAGVERVLTACPAAQCPDTAFLGADPAAVNGSGLGVLVGQAVLAVTHASEKGGLAVSFLAATANAVVGLPLNTSLPYVSVPGTFCGTPSAGTDYCRNWAARCDAVTSHAAPQFLSLNRTFTFTGDATSVRACVHGGGVCGYP